MASLYSHIEIHEILNTHNCTLRIFAVPVVEFREIDAKLHVKVWVKLETSGSVAQLSPRFALQTLDDKYLFDTTPNLLRGGLRSPSG